MTERDDPTPIRDWAAVARRSWRPFVREAVRRGVPIALVLVALFLLGRVYRRLPWHPDLGLIMSVVALVCVFGPYAVKAIRRRRADA